MENNGKKKRKREEIKIYVDIINNTHVFKHIFQIISLCVTDSKPKYQKVNLYPLFRVLHVRAVLRAVWQWPTHRQRLLETRDVH